MPRIELSPIVVGIFGITAGVLMVAAFHCIRVCSDYDDVRRRRSSAPPPPVPLAQVHTIRSHNEGGPSSSNNGSFSTVRLLIATNYRKECNEETCSVCLGEFNEGDEVRVLPGCAHVFHVLCIDKWLLSHSNCPLCRADTLCSLRDIAVVAPPNTSSVPPGTPPGVQGS